MCPQRQADGVAPSSALAASSATRVAGLNCSRAPRTSSSSCASTTGKYLNERGLRILAALDEAAAAHEGATPAQVALAWQIARPSVTAPIASATSLAQLEELVRGARLQLSPATLV
ncbi:MAG: aldo/keto reductase, partial [Comamonadaceae bacterium]